MGRRIFISYGHDEHADLARKLSADLSARGHEVWLDEAEIKGGRDWEIAIEEGLKATDVVLALLTPHAVRRPDGVCLDELSFARFLGRPIVPLMVQWCQPPLSISRLQWLDFQDWRSSDDHYARKFDQLVAVIEGGQQVDFEGSQAKLFNALDPLNYGAEIDRFLHGFVGRIWLLDEFEQWLREDDQDRIFLITGKPGVGKSAVASLLIARHPSVVAYHLCQCGNTYKSSALRCVKSLAYQLSTQLPNYRDLLLAENLDDLPQDAYSAFDLLITQPLYKLPRPDRRYAIVIDALDEAADRCISATQQRTDPDRNELVDLLMSQFDKTPDWLRLVATSRADTPILRKLAQLTPHELDAANPRNQTDLTDFLRAQLKTILPADDLDERRLASLVGKSEGNFLYATIVLQELRKGRLSIREVERFPQGLIAFYNRWFQRYFPDLPNYKQRQAPLLVLLGAAKAALPVALAKWALNWNDYDQQEALEPLGSLFPEIDGTIRPFHRSVIEWLHDRRQAGGYLVSQEDGIRALADICWRWSAAPRGEPRDYVLRYAVDHLLDRDREAPNETRVLDLCWRDDGAFLIEAIGCAGALWVEEQMRRVFALYVEQHSWSAAGKTLLYLRLLRQAASPIESTLGLLVGPVPGVIDAYIQDLGRIANESVQRAIALLAIGRLAADDYRPACNALLEWLRQRHHETLSPWEDEPDAFAFRAVLSFGPPDLADRLVQSTIIASDTDRFAALVTLWSREPSDSLRVRVLEQLQAATGDPASLRSQVVYAIARISMARGDRDLWQLVMRVIAESPVAVEIEVLPLADLLAWPLEAIVESMTYLCNNRRLQRFPTLRAAVCALMLMHPSPHDASALTQLAQDLGQAAGVPIQEISRAFADNPAAAFEIYRLEPAEFRHWLVARLPLITTWSEWANDPGAEVGEAAVVNKLVDHLCTGLRWIAAQSAASSADEAALLESLSAISGLAWRDSARWTVPFVRSDSYDADALDLLDPLRADTCWRTAQWLAAEGYLPFSSVPEWPELHRAATRAVVDQIFEDASPEDRRHIAAALESALGTPASREHDALTGSPWLQVFAAVAASADVPWQPAWSAAIAPRHEIFPDRLDSYIKQLRKRVVQIVEETGWQPQLFEIGLSLAAMQGEELIKDELQALLIPAVATLDPALVFNAPNDYTWPPRLLPLALARKIPRQLAATVGALEICERGMLWELCRDLCWRRTQTEWWDSLEAFRRDVRTAALETLRPRVIWFRLGGDDSPETLLEQALAPINLLLDDPPRKQDFDELAGESNADPASAYVRLKAFLNAAPKPEVLEWSVSTFRNRRYALWLIDILVANRRWDLLRALLNGLYGEAEDSRHDWLAGFRAYREEEQPQQLQRWQELLADAVGLGPEEGLIYRVDELAQQAIAGTLDQDEAIPQARAQIRLADDWDKQVRSLFADERTRKDELILTLLTITLLSRNQEPALLAEHLLAETSDALQDRLDARLLWVGKAVAPDLLREDRILRVARSGNGLDVLAALGRWDAVRLHLQSFAEEQSSARVGGDRLLQWYYDCASLAPDEQLACLQIYNELAPRLLAARSAVGHPAIEVDGMALVPVQEVSTSLKFSEYKLTAPLVAAARLQRVELVRAWFQAVIIEAKLGPDRQPDLDCLSTLCHCAGVWLTVEDDPSLKEFWISFLKQQAAVFKTRTLWNAFFNGVGMCLQPDMRADLQRWQVGGDYLAQLALAEALTDYGSLDNARAFWYQLLEGRKNPWAAIRACAAFLSARRGAESQRWAAEFAALACQQARRGTEYTDHRFLANITESAVRTQSGKLLEDIADLAATDTRRAVALGRIALDTFLDHARRLPDAPATQDQDQQHWTLLDIARVPGLSRLLLTLVDENADSAEEPDDIGDYDHDWQNNSVRAGLGWLDALLTEIFDLDHPEDLMGWVAGWIGRILPGRDAGGTVSKLIAEHAERQPEKLRELAPQMLDFVIAVAGDVLIDRVYRINLVLRLIAARYRTDECLALIDHALQVGQRYYSVDAILSKIVVVLARDLPDLELAEAYLARISDAAERYLAKDKLAEIHGVPLDQRLEELSHAPQNSAIIDQLIDLCEDMLGRLNSLSQNELGTLAPILARLSANNQRLNEQLARSVSDLQRPDDLLALRSYGAHIQRLSARIGLAA